MSQKICLFSFDYWNYDHHIVKTLNSMGYISHHIKFGDYNHISFKDKITNALSKIFTGKNLKKIRRQDYILKRLEALGKQDKILVINPEVINLKHHLKIKDYCNEYLAYLYDSVSRNPIQHLLNGVFDTIYSFDKKDIAAFNFKATSNYIYLPLETVKTVFKYDVVYVGSFDDRLLTLINVLNVLDKTKVSYKCIIVGKNKKLNHLKIKYGNKITFINKALSQKELLTFYRESKTIIDLVRESQTGLSFRFFEALALNKKVITNNINVKNYNFYNANNIIIIDDDIEIKETFLETKYNLIPESIYTQFTIKEWVKKVFNLKSK